MSSPRPGSPFSPSKITSGKTTSRKSMTRKPGAAAPGGEVEALRRRIADAVDRQHRLCAAKQACEAELAHLMKTRRGDGADSELAGLCDDKQEEMRLLAADAETAATEIGRASGDLLIFQLRSSTAPRKVRPARSE